MLLLVLLVELLSLVVLLVGLLLLVLLMVLVELVVELEPQEVKVEPVKGEDRLEVKPERLFDVYICFLLYVFVRE